VEPAWHSISRIEGWNIKKSATSVQELQTSSLSLTDGMQHASRKMLDEVAEKSPQQKL
jgi:hypothetical protein